MILDDLYSTICTLLEKTTITEEILACKEVEMFYSEDIIRNKERIRHLFEKVLEPELIELNDKKVCIGYALQQCTKGYI